MRRSRRAVLLAGGLLLAAALAGVRPGDAASPSPAGPKPAAPARAPGDTTVTRPMPLVDSTGAAERPVPVLDSTVVIPEIVRNPPHAPPDSLVPPDTLGLRIPVDTARKRGELNVAQLLSGRRPVWIETAPGFAPMFGAPRLLDSGDPVQPEPGPVAADRATDRTVLADFTHQPQGSSFAFGAPGLATAWDVPETRGIEAFDYVAVDSSLAPPPFSGPGELFTRPEAVPFSALAMPDPPRPYRVRSTLLYRKGAGSLLDTAARFSSPLFAHGIAGSYSRHASEALRPLLSSLSTRYYLAAGLTRGGALRSWVEGRLFKMRMEIDHPTEEEGAFTTPAIPARAEWAGREAALHALWTGGGIAASASLRAAKATATQIDYNELSRERWAYPEVGAEVRVSGGGSVPDTSGNPAGWSWSLAGTGSRRRVDFASDQAAFRPLVRLGRVTAEVRRAAGLGGVAASAAGDFRSGASPFVDGRVSWWGASGRSRFRLDAESAHERPSFVDLYTPARIDTVPSFVAPTLILTRGGDPTLRARALRGVLGEAAWRASSGVELWAFGSVRRVIGDFGWTAARSVFGDTISLVDAARRRGDGWVFQASAGGDATLGFLSLRGLGWVRGGEDGLAPQAGSPPKTGLDGSIGLRATLFQGDLPLQLELLGHAWGARRGIIAAPAASSWDARLHTDFGSAGIFVTVTNVFEAAIPSGVYRIDEDRGAPLPGRSLTAGVVWHIQD